MSLLPAFHPGVWNAWIPMLIFLLNPLLLTLIDNAVGTGDIMKKMGEAPSGSAAKRADLISTVILYALIAYSIFLPLKPGTAWFYAGLVFFLIGFAALLAAIVTAAQTPLGKLFTGGIYRFSRHPMYLAMMVMLAAVGIASASWLFLAVSAVLAAMQVSAAGSEERACLDCFGEEYREYQSKTPKWIGFPNRIEQ